MPNARPGKPSHWSTVTSAIAARYGISWHDAKFVYDWLKRKLGRPPGVRSLRFLPARIPRAVHREPEPRPEPARRRRLREPEPEPAPAKRWSKREPEPAPAPAKRRSKREPEPAPAPAKRRSKREPEPAPAPAKRRSKREPFELPPGAKFPPPLRKPFEDASARQPRSRFEGMLRERGLPVELAKYGAGKLAAHLWREPEKQAAIADLLGKALRQTRAGKPVSKPVQRALARLVGEDALISTLYQFVRETYSKPK